MSCIGATQGSCGAFRPGTKAVFSKLSFLPGKAVLFLNNIWGSPGNFEQTYYRGLMNREFRWVPCLESVWPRWSQLTRLRSDCLCETSLSRGPCCSFVFLQLDGAVLFLNVRSLQNLCEMEFRAWCRLCSIVVPQSWGSSPQVRWCHSRGCLGQNIFGVFFVNVGTIIRNVLLFWISCPNRRRRNRILLWILYRWVTFVRVTLKDFGIIMSNSFLSSRLTRTNCFGHSLPTASRCRQTDWDDLSLCVCCFLSFLSTVLYGFP